MIENSSPVWESHTKTTQGTRLPSLHAWHQVIQHGQQGHSLQAACAAAQTEGHVARMWHGIRRPAGGPMAWPEDTMRSSSADLGSCCQASAAGLQT